MPRAFALTLCLLTLAPAPALAQAGLHFQPLQLADLYAQRLRFRQGEPIVSIGVKESASAVELSAAAPLRLIFDEGGAPRSVFSPGGRRFALRPVNTRPAKLRYWVVVKTYPYKQLKAARAGLSRWARRGRARLFEVGALLALKGQLIDTRARQLAVGGYKRRAAAEARVRALFRQSGLRATVREELVSLPRGQIEVHDLKSGRRYRAGPVVCAGGLNGEPVAADGRRYWGHLYVTLNQRGQLAVVNSVGAERMLRGVVPAEIFASAPAEALKAQAVAARGELLTKLGHRHFGEPYHLCSEQHCQMYRGVDGERPSTNAAVAATRGLLLVRPQAGRLSLVDSVYSANCGGYSEANEVVWDDNPSPNLRARLDGDPKDPVLAPFSRGLNERNIRAWVEAYPPTYEAKSSFVREGKFRWRRRLGRAELDKIATKLKLGHLRAVKTLGRGPGGRVKGLRLIGSRGSHDVLRELPVRRLFGLNSGMFVIDAERGPDGALSALQFTGGGWGHGVGMCQVGAIGRAEAGQDVGQILRHYYRGAELRAVY